MMNEIFMSAVFLQKALSHSPSDIISRANTSIEKNTKKRDPWGNSINFAEKSTVETNRDFYKQLSKKRARNIVSGKKSSQIKENKTTLIIAPHPDDEILGTGNLIKEKLKSREKIKVIYLTNGDAQGDVSNESARAYGQHRKSESVKAVQKLGLKKSDLFFLEFPDAHSHKLPETGSVTSQFTGQNKTSPQSYFPNTEYSLTGLKKSLARIIEKIKPQEIYFTAKDDFNVDHEIVGELLPENPAKLFTYNVHRTHCKNEICKCDQPVDKEKLELIKIFQSQRHSPHHEKFLDQFACQKEVFTEVK